VPDLPRPGRSRSLMSCRRAWRDCSGTPLHSRLSRQLTHPERAVRPRSYFTGSGSCGIVVTQSHVTIRGRGPGAGGTLIDCAHRARHFTILGSNVTLAGMGLINGSARDGSACGGEAVPCTFAADGGCVLLAGAGATVADCTLSGCTAEGRGGAVFVARGKAAAAAQGAVALQRVHVSGCRATYGGGVWAGAAVSIGAGTTLRLCSAFHGGGVFVQGPGGSLTATWATVEGCRATSAGGGVHATLNASIRLDGVAVRGNAAGAHGGGVYIVEGGALAVVGDSAVQDNAVKICRFVSRPGRIGCSTPVAPRGSQESCGQPVVRSWLR
jgi:hypothetical protein